MDTALSPLIFFIAKNTFVARKNLFRAIKKGICIAYSFFESNEGFEKEVDLFSKYPVLWIYII